jgi:predicted RNA-binding Zn-ribbon protein involved in translation (DUF1610 family)
MSELTGNSATQGKIGEEQAKRAIRHVLGVIRDNAEVGWYMGAGTHSFDLLTEAAATLFDEPLEKVRTHFMPVHPHDPKEDGCAKETRKHNSSHYCPYCGHDKIVIRVFPCVGTIYRCGDCGKQFVVKLDKEELGNQ